MGKLKERMSEGPTGDRPHGVVRGKWGGLKEKIRMEVRRDSGHEVDDKAVSFDSEIGRASCRERV